MDVQALIKNGSDSIPCHIEESVFAFKGIALVFKNNECSMG